MSYQDELNSNEWKDLREGIVKRDKFKCQSCLNEKLIEGCTGEIVYRNGIQDNFEIDSFNSAQNKRGFAPKSIKRSNNYFGYFNKKDDKFYLELLLGISQKEYDYLKFQETFKYLEEVFQYNFTPESYYGLMWRINRRNKNKEDLSEISKKKYFGEKSIKMELKPEEYNIYVQSRLTLEKDFLYVKGLHVHHKYYQIGRLAWEYPESALITLCWLCHKDLHENEEIDVLDEEGNCINKFEFCKRCFGAGEFPEFRHVEGGICFRCHGAKYEELIEHSH